jgi:excisionase family DNA binding protein
MQEPELLRVPEAAFLLRSRSMAYALFAKNAIPTVRMGRAVRIPRRELLSWIGADTWLGSSRETRRAVDRGAANRWYLGR